MSDDWAGSARWARLEPLLLARGVETIWLPYTPDVSSSMIKQRIARLTCSSGTHEHPSAPDTDLNFEAP